MIMLAHPTTGWSKSWEREHGFLSNHSGIYRYLFYAVNDKRRCRLQQLVADHGEHIHHLA